MRIAIINPLYRYGADESRWITVPPQGYGGIQWVLANLISALADDGHKVLLLGAPGSRATPNVSVSGATTTETMREHLERFAPNIVHDHSQTLSLDVGAPTVRTHHGAGPAPEPERCTYLSRAHRRDARASSPQAPVIPLPVDPRRCTFDADKDQYLLFLGRVSAHKGVREAARFARAAGRQLIVAGPVWERPYAQDLLENCNGTVRFVGEVGGDQRRHLLARAEALMVLSQPHGAPWGGTWCEPGATVVSEAAASGTPVIASDNGCLPEIVPGVGHVLAGDIDALTGNQARAILRALPAPRDVRRVALARWGHRLIARRYVEVYRDVIGGANWR